jgi:bifunctional UDP-N-acetylglucosamine pyrophosphorylase/glucosamine-1-phosphate N-acetyltransferase
MANEILHQRILEQHMLAGVTIVDPKTTYIEDTVEIEADTTILPGCLLQGATKIGAHSIIGPYSQLMNSVVGRRCRVMFSVLEQARIEDQCEIGPFSHLRKGAHLAEGVHMGNFGEVKNSYLGPGTKMGHFSYVGDTHIGNHVNIGAGTITCNYDGERKHKTVIDEGAFIGSDTLLVAPVHIGAGARTGAGAVVTKDVPPQTLVYGVPARPVRVNMGEQNSASDDSALSG